MNEQAYTIVRNQGGRRFVKLTNGDTIPASIAALSVGVDLWMSQIKCKCRDCKGLFTLRELNGGGQWCEECQAAAVEDAG